MSLFRCFSSCTAASGAGEELSALIFEGMQRRTDSVLTWDVGGRSDRKSCRSCHIFMRCAAVRMQLYLCRTYNAL